MREHIISEIKRLAAENGGQAPGVKAFESATGIGVSKWRGKIWIRWSAALADAGFGANELRSKSDSSDLLIALVAACRHYKHFPTKDELIFLRQTDEAAPYPDTLRRNFGTGDRVARALNDFIKDKPEYADVLAMLPVIAPTRKPPPAGVKQVDGVVYLLKYGDNYKIGCGHDLEKRVKQIQVALPDAGSLIHSIKTDDPFGIEAYWHNRFKKVRANGEWFKLSPADVKAFMRRSFQ